MDELNRTQISLAQFDQLVRSRRAVRHFLPQEISPDLIKQLLDLSRWAPSGYNLQPTHMIVVTDTQLKEKLHPVCMKQAQILTAPAIIVFTGDRRVLDSNGASSVSYDLAAQAITPEYAKTITGFIKLGFMQGPLGINWLWKALLAPIARLFIPVPSIPAVHKRYWLAKQVMLSAMNFMLAAHAAGLATVPMEGFDEGRVKRILNIPAHHIVPVIIPVGYAASDKLNKTRLPLEQFIHFNKW